MDWQTKNEETLENLPLRERNHDYSWENDKYHGWNFPYRRVQRWLISRAGKHIDSVIHQYVNLEWLDTEYRNVNHLRRYLEMNTFMENGDIYFFGQWDTTPRKLKNEMTKTVYVHPITKIVGVHIPPTRKNYTSIYKAELAKRVRFLGEYHQLYKQNGIWYEVKATPVNKNFFKNHPFPSSRFCSSHFLSPEDIILEKKHEYPPAFKIVIKRQLNSKELKKFELKND